MRTPWFKPKTQENLMKNPKQKPDWLDGLRLRAEELHNKYLKLYEFSPIGYFTLDKQSTILSESVGFIGLPY